jgi:hypothetical protein
MKTIQLLLAGAAVVLSMTAVVAQDMADTAAVASPEPVASELNQASE